MMDISASLLGADLLRIGDELERAKDVGATWLHIDSMDGHFVPNIVFGAGFVEAVRAATDLFLDVHLLLEHPLSYIDMFADAGADQLIVHVEARDDVRQALEAIRARGLKAGVCINPGTPAEAVRPLLPLCDLVMVMTVEPGQGGQGLREDCLPKIAAIRRMINESGLPIRLSADGGIKLENAGRLIEAGTDVLVIGTGLFRSEDPHAVIAGVMAEAKACGR